MRLYLDAYAIIYAVEGNPQFRENVLARIIAAENSPNGRLITSRLSRLECRVKPLRDNLADVLTRYNEFFDHPRLIVSELTPPVIDRATDVRAAHGFRTPD